jgi:hypothetical protein
MRAPGKRGRGIFDGFLILVPTRSVGTRINQRNFKTRYFSFDASSVLGRPDIWINSRTSPEELREIITYWMRSWMSWERNALLAG